MDKEILESVYRFFNSHEGNKLLEHIEKSISNNRKNSNKLENMEEMYRKNWETNGMEKTLNIIKAAIKGGEDE